MERKDAKKLGLSKYTTGRPCINGHITHRYTSTGSCNECINGTHRKVTVEDSKTFRDLADKTFTTALVSYRDALTQIEAKYKADLDRANSYLLKASQYELGLIELERIAKSKQISKEHKELKKQLVTINTFIHPDMLMEAKMWMLELLQKHIPSATIDDVSYRFKVQGGVLHEVKCHPSDAELILSKTNESYRNFNASTIAT